MSKPKVLLAVLVALLAASACASAVASAEELPELRSSSFPIKYSGTISNAIWEKPGGNQFKCENGSTSEGEITGLKTLTAVIHFRGCKVAGVNSWCTSEGAPNGEIVTQPLEGTVVLNAPSWWKGFAVVFKPKSGVNVVNTFRCALVNSVVRGAVVVLSSTPRNKPTSTLELPFRQSLGTQEPNRYYTNEALEEATASLETTWASGVFEHVGWNFNESLSLSGTVTPEYPFL